MSECYVASYVVQSTKMFVKSCVTLSSVDYQNAHKNVWYT